MLVYRSTVSGLAAITIIFRKVECSRNYLFEMPLLEGIIVLASYSTTIVKYGNTWALEAYSFFPVISC